MDKIVLNAERREVIGKKVKLLRNEGKLPGIIYGKSTESIPIILDLKEATKILKATSSSSLLTINIDGEEFSTLVRERQRDFIRGNYLHVDFLSVSLTEKVRAKVNIVAEGEAPALNDIETLLTSGLDQIEVESLPQDLPEKFTVDLSSLEEVGDGIYVRDLEIPPNVELLADPDDMIVVITLQIIVEEEEEIDEEALLEGELLEEGEDGEVVPTEDETPGEEGN